MAICRIQIQAPPSDDSPTQLRFVADAVGRGGHVLFVGTKRQAAEVVREEAERAGQFYVTGRWLGGTLTNFRTMKSGIDRLREIARSHRRMSAQALQQAECAPFGAVTVDLLQPGLVLRGLGQYRNDRQAAAGCGRGNRTRRSR